MMRRPPIDVSKPEEPVSGGASQSSPSEASRPQRRPRTSAPVMLPPNGRNAAILFTASPTRERKKFSPLLPKEGNQEIAANLLLQTLSKLAEYSQQDDFDVIIVSDEKFNLSVAERFKCRFLLHRGTTFAARITNAIKDIFALGYEKVTLVGNDCPMLSERDFQKSFRFITDSSVVFGPAKDGGIYLIGFPRSLMSSGIAIEKLPWKTHGILNDLISCFTGQNFDVMLLREKHDLDTISDLANFINAFDSTDESSF
ncbi:MAG: DUF2064 domain-containing protein [Chlorobiales bacterium]|nr:DUF2064 domain-containing protein [Chlorobiales bacterium]